MYNSANQATGTSRNKHPNMVHKNKHVKLKFYNEKLCYSFELVSNVYSVYFCFQCKQCCLWATSVWLCL